MWSSLWNTHRRALEVALLALVMGLIPLVDRSPYHLSILIQVGIFTLLVIGLNLVMGYAGQISLGHAAFYGLGAYASAMTTVYLGINPWLAMIGGMVFTGLIALVIGIPIFRLKGHYLAMATLGFGIIVHLIFKQFLKEWTGGPTGLPGVPHLAIGSFVFDNDVRYFYLVWFFVVVVMVLALNLVNSRIGRALRSIHSSEEAAESLGVDTARYKLQVLIVSAVFASLAGSLRAHYNLHVSPASFTFISSVELVVMSAVGGLASIWGAPFGAAVVYLIRPMMREIMPRLLDFRSGEYELIAYGVMLVIIMIVTPEGLVAGMGNLLRRWERRKEVGSVVST